MLPLWYALSARLVNGSSVIVVKTITVVMTQGTMDRGSVANGRRMSSVWEVLSQ